MDTVFIVDLYILADVATKKRNRESINLSSLAAESSKHVKRDRTTPPKFKVGDELEAEMMEKNDYEGTIHPVRVSEILDDGLYRCKLIAFGEDESIWLESQLHQIRGREPNREYTIGQNVHFLFFNRSVKGRRIDGRLARQVGIWVKGTIEKFNEKQYTVQVNYNDCNSGRKKVWVMQRDLRTAYKNEK